MAEPELQADEMIRTACDTPRTSDDLRSTSDVRGRLGKLNYGRPVSQPLEILCYSESK